MPQDPFFIFSLNSGRSGSTSLGKSLSTAGPKVAVYHERLDINDHGVVTPDVGLLRRFNSYGMMPETQTFWAQRHKVICESMAAKNQSLYIETSHMLAKAGLVEWLCEDDNKALAKRTAFINLTRRPEAIARSIYERRGLTTIESRWLWFLDPDYVRNLVDIKDFAYGGRYQVACWYVMEMRQRIIRWEKMLKTHKIPFLSIDIESPDVAAKLTAFLGTLDTGVSFSLPATFDHENKHGMLPKRMEVEDHCKKVFNHYHKNVAQ